MARKIVSSYAVFENLGGTRDIVFYKQEDRFRNRRGLTPTSPYGGFVFLIKKQSV